MDNKNNKIANLFSAKLKYYMDKAGIKSPELGEKLGVTGATIRHWCNGARFPKDILIISEIADLLNVSIIDLLPYSYEEKVKIVKNELSENIENYTDFLPLEKLPENIKAVSFVGGYVGAGSYGESNAEMMKEVYVDLHAIEKAYRNKDLKAIKVSGDSMKPYVDSDDIVLFCPLNTNDDIKGDGKYIISTNMGGQVKNLKFMLNGNIRIISENPSYHTKDGYDEEVDKDSQEYLNIIGKVVGRILKG